MDMATALAELIESLGLPIAIIIYFIIRDIYTMKYFSKKIEEMSAAQRDLSEQITDILIEALNK